MSLSLKPLNVVVSSVVLEFLSPILLTLIELELAFSMHEITALGKMSFLVIPMILEKKHMLLVVRYNLPLINPPSLQEKSSKISSFYGRAKSSFTLVVAIIF